MSLDIGVGNEAGKPPIATEPHFTLDNDGYYWFLYPLFEALWSETGQYIDLYGGAAFTGSGLEALGRMLTEARRLVAAQPETWEVYTGTQVQPQRREVYRSVERAEFMRLLGQWELALERARQTGLSVVCFGD